MYLLDANVLIRANGDYYPIDRVRPFWDWLLSEGSADRVKIPQEIYDEISNGRDEDDLVKWIKDQNTQDALVLKDEVDTEIFNQVIDKAYAPDLTDTETGQMGRDPFLITYALMDKQDRRVVTKEVSKTRSKRGNRKIPDVCKDLGIVWMDDFTFYRQRDFRIQTIFARTDSIRPMRGLTSAQTLSVFDLKDIFSYTKNLGTISSSVPVQRNTVYESLVAYRHKFFGFVVFCYTSRWVCADG